MKATPRIAFLLSVHSMAFRGVGVFAASFLDMASRHKWIVDMVTDGRPRSNAIVDRYNSHKVQWYTPDAPVDYNMHKQLFFWQNGICLEAILNFRQALVKAMSNHVYDLVICNTPEAVLAAHNLSLGDAVNVVYYTHEESSTFYQNNRNDVFTDQAYEIFSNVVLLPSVTIATQSSVNKKRIVEIGGRKRNVVVLPYPPTDDEIWTDKRPKSTKGVGNITVFESRKNVGKYLELLKETGLPGVVITTKRSGQKFIKKADEMGIELDVHTEVSGREKAEIIAGMRVAYHPSSAETFGLGVMETAYHCPTFVLDGYDWVRAQKKWVRIVDKKDVAGLVLKAYRSNDRQVNKDAIRQHIERTDSRWTEFVLSCTQRQPAKTSRDNDLLRYLDTNAVSVRQWMDQIIKKGGQVRVTEIEKVHRAPARGVTVVQTRRSTWLTKDKQFKPPKDKQNDVSSLIVRRGF